MEAATLFSEYVKNEDYRLFVVVNYISYLGFFTHLSFIPLFYWIGFDSLAYFNIISVMAWFAAFVLNRYGRHVLAVLLITVEVFLHAVIATYYLGWDSGFHYYLIPFILFIFINHKQSMWIIAVQVALVFIVYFWLLINTQGVGFQTVISEAVVEGLLYINITVNFFAIGLLGYSLRTSSMRAEWEMEQLAITDSLTGLYNRRKMLEMLELESTRCKRSGKNGVLVISDIDWFKAINDEFGHDCGDMVLKQVSALMTQTLRKQDVLARWGGEEFMLLLPETDVAGAVTVIEILRESIAKHAFHDHKEAHNITMTFGLVVFDDKQPIKELIKQADRLLFKGKHQGRNCIVSANDAHLADCYN